MGAATYRNPVIEPDFADPTVIKGEDGYYYAYSTETDWSDGHGKRLVPIMCSKDLTNWEYARDAFAQKPNWFPEGAGIWAPDISRKGSLYYLFYSVAVWGDHEIPAIGVATSDHPAGPFTDHGPVVQSLEIGVLNSIDPMHFVDDDGTSYLIWGSFNGIYGIPLRDDALRPAGQKFLIAGSRYEAAQVLKQGAYYYLFASAGSCCDGLESTYHIRIGRSESVRGPYTDQEGRDLRDDGGTLLLAGMRESDGSGGRFCAPGHHCIVRDAADKTWMFYHAIDVEQPYLPNGWTRRPTLMDPVDWRNEWPVMGSGHPSTQENSGPFVR